MKHIFRYEFKKMTADGTLWGLTAILFLFVLLAVFNGSRWADFQRKNLAELSKDQQARLEKHVADINDYNRENDFVRVEAPQGASSVGTYTMRYIAKPPHPNAIFAVGQSDLYPYYVRFTAIRMSNMLFNEEIVNPVNLLVGKLDYSFFIVYLLPLLIIAMAYELLTSEREQGTFTLLRIYQPRTSKFLLAKWLFRVLWLLAVLYVAVFAGMLLFSPFALREFDTGTFAIVGFSTVYALFWFALCYAVNMLGRNSLFNGIALTMFWLFVVFLLPTVANTLMEKKHPVPSRNAQVVQQRENEKRMDREKNYRAYLLDHPEYPDLRSDTVGNAVIPRWYRAYLVSRIPIDSLSDAGEKTFAEALEMQEKGLLGLSYASPSLMANLVFNRIGRNALGDFGDFDAQAKQQQQRWRAFVYDKLLRGHVFTTEDLNDRPNFTTADLRDVPTGPVLLRALWVLFLSALLMASGMAWFKRKFL